MPIVLGATGIFTPIIEGTATAIGAGVVIGGFLGASAGMINGWSRREVERGALRDTYGGALVALVFWALDQCIVYASVV